MRRRGLRAHPPAAPLATAALTGALILGGTLLWLVPYLTRQQQPVAGVPTPPPLFALSEFVVPAHERACMESVTITPSAHLAQFQLRPAAATATGGPPVELILRGPHYQTRARVPPGYPGGAVTLTIVPPPRALIGSACFLNLGAAPVAFDGTTEPRTVARSVTRVGDRPVVGDISLTFLQGRRTALLDRLGEVFSHASNLTDRLVPVWLIWILAVLVSLGVPLCVIGALYLALRMDEAGAQS